MNRNEVDAPWQVHYDMIGQLYEKADANESSITQVSQALQKATDALHVSTKDLPAVVSAGVKHELDTFRVNFEHKMASLADNAGDRITDKFRSANIKAEQAEAAYEVAAKFAIWKVSGIAVSVSAIPFLIMYFLFMPDLRALRVEEHTLTREVERLKRDVEVFRRMEGAGWIFGCPDGNETKLCIRTDERAFKGKPHVVGNSTFRAISQPIP